MTNQDILEVAMQQSAIDANCLEEDFKKSENVIVESVVSANARKYLELPFACNLISYGNNIVASINLQYKKRLSSCMGRDDCKIKIFCR